VQLQYEETVGIEEKELDLVTGRYLRVKSFKKKLYTGGRAG
jgi:hypothetical protein